MANGSRYQVLGKGIVKFRLPSGKFVRRTEVQHIPGVKKNLISLGMLDARGYSFSACESALQVCQGERELLEGRMIGGLHWLVGSVVTGGVAVRHRNGMSGIGCFSWTGEVPVAEFKHENGEAISTPCSCES